LGYADGDGGPYGVSIMSNFLSISRSIVIRSIASEHKRCFEWVSLFLHPPLFIFLYICRSRAFAGAQWSVFGLGAALYFF
jgi:hypothetical protein